MKVCRLTLFEAGRAVFVKNSDIFEENLSRVLTVKAVLQLIVLSHLKNRWSQMEDKAIL